MGQMMETFHSTTNYVDQDKLATLSAILVERMADTLEELGVRLKGSERCLYGPCPVHGGDKFNAFNLYQSGSWACRTHNCQNVFKNSAIGMVRGILSHREFGWEKEGDKTYGFFNTIKWLEKFLGIKLSTMKIDANALEKARFASQMAIMKKTAPESKRVTREQVRASLEIPATYYIKRRYSKEILDRYDIGFCTNREKEMRYRVVVPVYNENGDFAGCCGRSIFERCDRCRLYHHEDYPCPPKDYEHLYSKWKHSGFKAHENLYNYANAKPYIQKSQTVIVVESPGNVWRLEEAGIHNSVAIFGSTISEAQKSILDGSGALNIIVIGDNDDAGRGMCEDIRMKCERTYRIFCAIPEGKNDIGDMAVQEVKDKIVPIIESIR